MKSPFRSLRYARGGRPSFHVVLLVTTLIAVAGCAVPGTSSTPDAAPAAILGWSPGITRGLPLMAPVTLYFSRNVDHVSVQQAWTLVPKTPGSFTWNDTAVQFQPLHGFRAGAYYRLSLKRTARDDQGKLLRNTFATSFTTGDALKILSASPRAGSSDVPVNGMILITFNHPMVPLAGLGAPAVNPPGWHLAITPATTGHGSWLNTSIWEFHPDHGLVPSSTYTVSLGSTVRDVWGVGLATGSGLHLQFRTVTPQIVGEDPADGTRYANPSGDIRVTFNQAMDTSTASPFSLHLGGVVVPGTDTWQGNTLVFHPATPLASGQEYRAKVAAGARSLSGQATLGRTVSWAFEAAPAPRVLSSTPAPGAVTRRSFIEIRFSSPIEQQTFDRNLTVTPPIASMVTYSSNGPTGAGITGPIRSGATAFDIGGNFLPSTSYSVTLGTGTADVYGRHLATPYTLRFTTAPLDPSVALYGITGFSQNISVSAGSVVRAPIQFVNVESVHYNLRRTTIADLSYYYFHGGNNGPQGVVLRDWTESVVHPLNRVQNQTVLLGAGTPLKAGLYWLSAQVSPTLGYQSSGAELVAVTDLNVTLKTTSGHALAWVTSNRTGRPVTGAAVRLLGAQGSVLDVGITGRSGLVRFSYSAQASPIAAVVDSAGFGMASIGWQAGYQNYYPAQLVNGRYVAPPTGTYAYTDRPVYRPGQMVHFRAVIWNDHDGVYSLFGPRLATVDVRDMRYHAVYSVHLSLDRFGVLHGKFRLPAQAATGVDNVTISLPASSSNPAQTSFAVAEYRKPEFLTSISSSQKSYVQGQTLAATVRVRYVFGAPVVGQPVQWTVYRQNRFAVAPGYENYQFGDQDAIQQEFSAPQSPANLGEGPFGVGIATGMGTTDASGAMLIRLPVDISTLPLDQTFTIEASTTDINHQTVTGRMQLPVYKAGFGIGVATQQQIVLSGHPTAVDIVAVRPDGTPVQSQALHIVVTRRTYTSELAAGPFGVSFWRQVAHDSAVSQQDVTSNARGHASVQITPHGGGEYYTVVTGADGEGNTARSGLAVYSGDQGFTGWGVNDSSSVSLKPDRVTYRVGDTAHLLVAAPFSGASALITVERGTIRQAWIEHFAGNSPTIDVPITLSDLPNVFVSVTLFRGWRGASPPDWRYGSIELHVRLDPRLLVIHLIQDRAQYHPGDRVTYTLRTTDAAGRPVAAQLSLALVDTAVLALQDDFNAPILPALYGERSLQVEVASDGAISINHLQQQPNFQLQPGGGGGGGGGGGPQVPSAHLPSDVGKGTKVRTHFADTAYWHGALVTNNAGRARVSLILPDNLTTWRLDVRGVTIDQRVGQATLETVSTQDIVLRPVAPRFLLEGDSVRLGAVVNNNLGTPVVTAVTLNATGISLRSSPTQQVTVPAHGEILVLWNSTVLAAKSARLMLRAVPSASTVRGDAVQVTVAVHVPLTAETVAAAGQVFTTEQQSVIVPANALRRPGALTVEISSSLIAGVGRAFDSLRPTPYDSNEDIANRVLAAVSLKQVAATRSGLSALSYRRLPKAIQTGVKALMKNELPDGGWSWFGATTGAGDVTVTTDVVEALDKAHVAVPIPARAFLLAGVTKMPAGTQAHVLLVLRLAGTDVQKQVAVLSRNTPALATLDPAARADLAQTQQLGGDAAASGTTGAQLDSSAMVSATGAHWESYAAGSAVTSTARVLAALTMLTPTDPFIPAAARWLMSAREGPVWSCGHDTAQALSALSRYARAAEQGRASYRYTVAVDGVTRNAGTAATSNAGRLATVRFPIASLHRGRVSHLVFARQAMQGNLGMGSLFWVAQLQYFLPAQSIAARDQGVSITREYLDVQGHPLTSVAAGTTLAVRLSVHTGQTLNHLQINDPLPAGFEPLDQSLNTSRQGLPVAWLQPNGSAADLSNYVAHTDLRDDRTSVFVSSLPPGDYSYTYLVEATVSGRYAVAPVQATETFFPEVFGRGAGQTFIVR